MTQPTNETVERVARAIYDDWRGALSLSSAGPWENIGADDREDWLSAARAAIAAMLSLDGEAMRERCATTGIETDEDGEAMVCAGCGTTRTVAAIRAASATAFTCCPERKMVPVRRAASRINELEAALKPFIDIGPQQGAWGVISKKLDGLAPLTVTVTKAQMLAAIAALAINSDANAGGAE